MRGGGGRAGGERGGVERWGIEGVRDRGSERKHSWQRGDNTHTVSQHRGPLST